MTLVIPDACIDALRATLASPEAARQRATAMQEKKLTADTLAAWRVGAFVSSQHLATTLKRTVPGLRVPGGLLRRDVIDALAIPWPAADGTAGGLIFRRQQPLAVCIGEATIEVRYALLGERDDLPLMGLDSAVATGRREVVLVEGTFDFLRLRQAGATEVVTANSCALRPRQLQGLQRAGITSLVLCLDPDEAGDRATFSAVQLCAAMGLATRVAPRLPDGVDADTFVDRVGLAGWQAHLAGAIDGLVYAAHHVMRMRRGGPAGADTAVDTGHACLAAAAEFHANRPPGADQSDLLERFWPPLMRALAVGRESRDAVIADAYSRRMRAPGFRHVMRAGPGAR